MGWGPCVGQYTDPETGLIYLDNRYYDPTTGQFITSDPLEAVTQQPYAYAGDDPINETDPTGLFGWNPISDVEEAGSDVGGAASTAWSGISSGATWVANHPVETVGLVAGGVSLATGVGEVVAGGAAVTEGVLGTVSVGSGVVAAGVDTHYCLAGSDIACVGAVAGGVGAIGGGISLAATGSAEEGAEALAFEGGNAGAVKAGATAIGLTFGGIGLLGDLAASAKGATLGEPCDP